MNCSQRATRSITVPDWNVARTMKDGKTHSALGERTGSSRSLPLQKVPDRGSSLSRSRQTSLQDISAWSPTHSNIAGETIPLRGKALSPVKTALEQSTITSDALRTSPSRTFVNTTPALDTLDYKLEHHPRLEMSIQLTAPIFVGGGTVEGQISLAIDKTSTKKQQSQALFISKLSVDVLGIEEVSDGRKHPPPASIVITQKPIGGSELYWQSKLGVATIPFCLNLPLNLGPPPYISKHACIRYVLHSTLAVRNGGKRISIFQSRDIQMFTVHDPEKALASLTTPLVATNTTVLPSDPTPCSVKLTAGLHRQTWINSNSLFIDLHVTNNTRKPLKRINLQLEKTTLYFKHPAAGTVEKSAGHLRLPKRIETQIINTTSLKKSKQWGGISAMESELRTCDVFIPRGHATVGIGRYFEVRYFVSAVVPITVFKSVEVQLPITIIHMNSLDILPNALAQVAASIEAKRSRTLILEPQKFKHATYYQGQAFVAPRRGFVQGNQDRASSVESSDIKALMRDLDNSPRRNARTSNLGVREQMPAQTVDENVAPGRPSLAPSFHGHHVRHPSCYHCQIVEDTENRGPSSADTTGLKLPRLQVSTSGLGFSESEFEIPADSPPRKVMLSESERKLISQQRELQLRRKHSRSVQRGGGPDAKQKSRSLDIRRWHNVTAGPDGSPRRSKTVRVDTLRANAPIRVRSAREQHQKPPRSQPNEESFRHHHQILSSSAADANQLNGKAQYGHEVGEHQRRSSKSRP